MGEYVIIRKDQFISQSEMAAVILDAEFRVIECNDQFLYLVGMSKEQVKKLGWHDIIIYDYPYTPLENREIFKNIYAIPSGKFWCSIKGKIPRKIISATIAYNMRENSFYVTLYDISVQLTPDRLMQDGGLFTGIVAEHMNGAIGFHDKGGIIKFVSREICKMIGLDKRDILGKNINEFFNAGDVKEWMYLFRNRTDKLPKYLEFNSSDRGGRVFHAMATPKVFFDLNKNPSGCMFVFSDITELKLEEKKLRISDEKYSKAFYASPAPSSITTYEDGRYIDVNESYLKLVGYSKDELIGRTTTEIDFFTDNEDRVDFINELTKTGILRDYETHIFSRVKGLRTFSLSAEIIELQGEKCIIWAGYDVTDQIRLEKEVLTASGRERYNIGQALHDDLGQLLVGIDAMFSLLKNRLKPQNNSVLAMAEEIHDYLKEAHEKVRALSRGLCPIRLEENGLSSGISEFVTTIEKMHGIKCSFVNLNNSIMIYNSQIAINMFYIVQEAVNNAIKHGKADKITITYYSNDDKIYLAVEDNGRGFKWDKIVSPGMGLAIMRYRARAIGGSLDISSSPGNGTFVLIKFPKINNKQIEWDWKVKTYEEIANSDS